MAQTSLNNQETTDPLTIQVLKYPEKPDRDLPTASLVSKNEEQLNVLLDTVTFDKADSLYEESIDPKDSLIPLSHIPAQTCYRNSALSALFNISPFLNFLNQVAQSWDARNVILKSLHGLADVSRHRTVTESTTARRRRLEDSLKTFWDEMTGNDPMGNNYRDTASSTSWDPTEAANDPSEFISELFDRIVTSDLADDQVGQDGR